MPDAGEGGIMRALLQRVTRAQVSVNSKVVGRIGAGLTILLGLKEGDTPMIAEWMAGKVAHLRIFADQEGKTNLSAHDIGAEMLVISQFTLYADCRRGRRPGFSYAARPETAEPLYEHFMRSLRELGFTVATGSFGAEMLVEIHNEGPFTILLDSDELPI
jgi:D-tyrosyl-tRNA(Tyr) deacylase